MNPLAISVLLSDEFSSVREQLQKNYELEWKITISELLKPEKETHKFYMTMSDEIVFKLIDYLDSMIDKNIIHD